MPLGSGGPLACGFPGKFASDPVSHEVPGILAAWRDMEALVTRAADARPQDGGGARPGRGWVGCAGMGPRTGVLPPGFSVTHLENGWGACQDPKQENISGV